MSSNSQGLSFWFSLWRTRSSSLAHSQIQVIPVSMALRWSIRRKVRLSGGLGCAATDKIKEDKWPRVADAAQSLHAVAGVETMKRVKMKAHFKHVLEYLHVSVFPLLIICKYSNCPRFQNLGSHLNVLFLVTEHLKYFLSNVCNCVYRRSQWLSWLAPPT